MRPSVIPCARDFVETDGDSLAEVHGGMGFAGGNVGEPVAVAEVVVGEADFFGSEENRDALGGEGVADEVGGGFEGVHGVLGLAVAKRGGSDDEGAVGDGFGEAGEFLGLLQDVGRAHGGAGFAEGEVVGLDDAEMEESEVAHGAGSGAEVERVASADEDDAEVVGCREQEGILRPQSSVAGGRWQMVLGRRLEPDSSLVR